MANRRTFTEEERRERKYVMLYINQNYLEPFNEAVDASEAEGRAEYVKAVVLQDLVRRGIMDAKEIPRRDRHLLDI